MLGFHFFGMAWPLFTPIFSQMNGLPVGLSLTASFVSALTIMGTPAEVYTHGTMFLWFTFVYMASVGITAYIFAPKFYELGFSSVYEVK